jgi:pimeloyl-ACP methyl ester carboxylesterase
MPYHDHLYYEIEGAGRPLLFLHCPGLSGLYWRPILDRLQGRFQAVTFDLPGHGRSADRNHLWSYPEIVDRVIALADHLALPTETVLVGYSTCATIALMAAARAPTRWGGVAAVSVPTPTAWDLKLKLAIGEYALRHGKTAWIGKNILSTNHVDRAHYRLMLNHATTTSPLAYASIFRETPRWDPLAFASQIQIPVRVIHGQKDRWALPHTRRLVEALPNASLWFHPKSDHRVPTRQPDWLTAELLAFDAQLAGGASRKL